MINRITTHPKTLLVTAISIMIGGSFWLMLDTKMPVWMRIAVVADIGIACRLAKDSLESEQSDQANTLLQDAQRELIQQATVNGLEPVRVTTDHPSKTVLATIAEDKTGLAADIQSILDAYKTETAFIQKLDAPRITRVLLQHQLGSVLPQNLESLSPKIWTGLAHLQIKKQPIITIVDGLLAVDIPKQQFQPVVYQSLKNQIRSLPTNRVIGVSVDGFLITQELNQFSAFTCIGGKTRSGKSNLIRQWAVEFLTNNPTAILYCIELKENTFKLLEGQKQLYKQSVAYDVQTAAGYVKVLHTALLTRIEAGKTLTGVAYQNWLSGLPPLFLFFDEYKDDELYQSELETIFKKGAQYNIFGVLGTQTLNKTKSGGEATFSSTLKAQCSTKISFLVEDHYNSQQILGSSVAKDLLGQGDGFYKSDQELDIQRFQAVFYTDEDVLSLLPAVEKQLNTNHCVAAPHTIADQFMDVSQLLQPKTLEWQVLEFVEKSDTPQSLTAIARAVNASRKTDEILQILEKLREEGLIRAVQAKNGKSVVFSKI